MVMATKRKKPWKLPSVMVEVLLRRKKRQKLKVLKMNRVTQRKMMNQMDAVSEKGEIADKTNLAKTVVKTRASAANLAQVTKIKEATR